MTTRESVAILLAISLLGLLCFYGVRPVLEQMGWSAYRTYLVSLSIPFLVMLAWSGLAFLHEGNQRTWESFLRRIQLKRLTRSVAVWSTGLGLFMLASTLLFSPLISRAISRGLLPMPTAIPDYINPVKQLSVTQIGAQLASEGVVPLIPFVLVLNILGEEIFWRGMIFPRQELTYGKRTFLVHGTIWALSHAFQYWLIPPILLSSLALAYVFQRSKNTWIGILGHAFNNGLPLAIIILVGL
ncbi:MAG TPA: CPBP family intramembrane glutamic endopeptidase [Anaerolineae bacterium]|nr:CPBP family intramembrane glutamic endopeptidase [Anaerolineae bacterium]